MCRYIATCVSLYLLLQNLHPESEMEVLTKDNVKVSSLGHVKNALLSPLYADIWADRIELGGGVYEEFHPGVCFDKHQIRTPSKLT